MRYLVDVILLQLRASHPVAFDPILERGGVNARDASDLRHHDAIGNIEDLVEKVKARSVSHIRLFQNRSRYHPVVYDQVHVDSPFHHSYTLIISRGQMIVKWVHKIFS